LSKINKNIFKLLPIKEVTRSSPVGGVGEVEIGEERTTLYF
jgi:hypothetical protein